MNQKAEKSPLYIHYAGPALIETPLLNKGTAFSKLERTNFNLMGLLPPRYESIEEQVERAYLQYSSFQEPINKHIYLRAIQDSNETLFFKLVNQHIAEMMPIIYTPTVGDACEKFSDIYRSNRGLFISYTERDQMDDILRNATKQKVKVIVVTDGERILGLGDQGIGGMGIPIGKLSLYTACGGISPAYTMPITLDVGTNNPKLLNDPMYMGERHERISQYEYDAFVDKFITAAQKRWPGVMIQFEDFAQPNAMPLLKRYRDKVCCFNDDIQGTAAVTVGTLLAACRKKDQKLSEQNVTFVGAGSAGCGIAEQVIMQMVAEGLTDSEARKKVFMIDRFGLVTNGMSNLRDFQQALAQESRDYEEWNIAGEYPTLVEVMENAKPGILIGVSGVPGLFTEQAIKTMHKHDAQPIIFPLSNPIKQIEAHPKDVIEWTNGNAIIATGSPFNVIDFNGRSFEIAQCNNAYIFPGIGLGVLAVGARIISDEMIMASSETLAQNSPLVNEGEGALLPELVDLPRLSKEIAFNVAKVAIEQGHALAITDEEIHQRIEKNFWTPEYRPYKRVSA
ncbi:NAD-dependent malic enzyme [Psychrosphaera aestuarii]|uniref:NAD-dependent malic enzyme n=1 Tax=Psychrosphaera aestuarii TaxID=1266052 RepID=UPI001B33F899|nr:NAD-dependent malic enzyme [Psychrosphaera aestuarii]